MRKNIYFAILAVLSLGLLFASCGDETGNNTNTDEFSVKISVEASMGETRTEYDEATSKAVWKAGDKIYAVSAAVSTSASNNAWTALSMSGTSTSTNATFSGNLRGRSEGLNDVFFMYAGSGYADPSSFTLPKVQKPTLTSFDGNASLMFGKPAQVELTTTATAQSLQVQFLHYTGFLKLTLADLPSDVLGNAVESVVMDGGEGAILSRYNSIYILNDGEVQEYDVRTTNSSKSTSITLDYSDKGLTLADLTTCWFTMMPGEYPDLTFTINYDGGRLVYAPRSGLVIESGVIKEEQLTFREGDEVAISTTTTVTFDCATDFPIGTPIGANVPIPNGEATVTAENGESITFEYSGLTGGYGAWVPVKMTTESYFRNKTATSGRLLNVTVYSDRYSMPADFVLLNYKTAENSTWPMLTQSPTPMTYNGTDGTFYGELPTNNDYRHFMFGIPMRPDLYFIKVVAEFEMGAEPDVYGAKGEAGGVIANAAGSFNW